MMARKVKKRNVKGSTTSENTSSNEDSSDSQIQPGQPNKKRKPQPKLPNHIKRIVTPSKDGVSEPEVVYSCSICIKTSKSYISFTRYHKYCAGDTPKPFKCKVKGCGKSFCLKCSLKIHALTHTGKRPFVCAICNNGFSTKAGLWQHQRTVHESPVFKCSSCPSVYKRKEALQQHVQIFHGCNRKLFKCDICQNNFRYQRNLSRHRKLHAEVKAFPCHRCDDAFPNEGALERHVLKRHTASEDDRFCCQHCGKGFRLRGNLQKHVKAFHSESPVTYHCTVCKKSSRFLSNMKKHMRAHFKKDEQSEEEVGNSEDDNLGVPQRQDEGGKNGMDAAAEKVQPVQVSEELESGDKPQMLEDAMEVEAPSPPPTPEERAAISLVPMESEWTGPRLVLVGTPMPPIDEDEREVEMTAITEESGFRSSSLQRTEGDVCNPSSWNWYRQPKDPTAPHISKSKIMRWMEEHYNRMEVDGGEAQETNPLVHHVVLETLFKFAAVEDLKSWRQVCKYWWEESMPRWRREKRLLLKDGDLEEEDDLTLAEFMRMTKLEGDPFRLIKYPYAKYCLEGFNLQLFKGSVELQFFNKFGGKMKELDVCKSTFGSTTDFHVVLFALTPQLRKLSLEENKYLRSRTDEFHHAPSVPQLNLTGFSLKLVEVERATIIETRRRVNLIDSNWNVNLPQTSWAEIMDLFPNLEEVRLDNLICDSLRFPRLDVEGFLETIADLKQTGSRRPPLQSLDILTAFRPAFQTFPVPILARLRSLRLPLSSLSIDIGVKTRSGVFKEILNLHAGTLRKLKIFRGPKAKRYRDFPFDILMENVEELTFIGPVCPDLLFLEYFPNLKILRAVDDDKPQRTDQSVSLVRRTDFSDLEGAAFPHLEEFLDAEDFCTRYNVKSLAKIMPNLRSLRLGLDKSGVEEALQNWDDLKSLHIQPYRTVVEKETLIPDLASSNTVKLTRVQRRKNSEAMSILISKLKSIKVNDSEGEDAIQLLTASLSRLQM